MHYRNGRKANNGDKIVQLQANSGTIVACGQLQNAVAGNDNCNGELVITGYGPCGPALIIIACICDCLHVEDLAAIISEKGLEKRRVPKMTEVDPRSKETTGSQGYF